MTRYTDSKRGNAAKLRTITRNAERAAKAAAQAGKAVAR